MWWKAGLRRCTVQTHIDLCLNRGSLSQWEECSGVWQCLLTHSPRWSCPSRPRPLVLPGWVDTGNRAGSSQGGREMHLALSWVWRCQMWEYVISLLPIRWGNLFKKAVKSSMWYSLVLVFGTADVGLVLLHGVQLNIAHSTWVALQCGGW